jgi:hypothetical protein
LGPRIADTRINEEYTIHDCSNNFQDGSVCETHERVDNVANPETYGVPSGIGVYPELVNTRWPSALMKAAKTFDNKQCVECRENLYYPGNSGILTSQISGKL